MEKIVIYVKKMPILMMRGNVLQLIIVQRGLHLLNAKNVKKIIFQLNMAIAVLKSLIVILEIKTLEFVNNVQIFIILISMMENANRIIKIMTLNIAQKLIKNVMIVFQVLIQEKIKNAPLQKIVQNQNLVHVYIVLMDIILEQIIYVITLINV